MKVFLQREIYIGFFLILFSLFSKAKSDNNNNTFIISQVKAIDKEVENNKLYAKIEVKGNSTEINYALSAYSDKERKTRIQLAQSLNGITKLYLSPNQIKGKMFINLECSDYPCNGTIDFFYLERIDLMEGETLSYYVTKDTENMEFSLIPNTSSQISNIWARGHLNITTTLSLNNSNVIQKDNYYIVNLPINKTNFNVKGKSGDFINVGFIGYTKEQNNNKNNESFYISNTILTVDENIITVYLKKETIDSVCYPMQARKCLDSIETLFGSGIVFTKIAYTYKIFKNGTILDQMSDKNLFNMGNLAHFFYPHEIYEQNICFSFPSKEQEFEEFEEIQEIILTYQIESSISSQKGLNLYEPQLNGIFYPRFLRKNQKAFFIPQDGDFSKMTLNLMSKGGFPKMSIADCDNYPLCGLDNDNKTLTNMINSSMINRFSSLSYDKKSGEDYSPISKNQKLMVIECQEGEKIGNESKYYDENCIFFTLMNKEQTKIELIEDEYFNKFATKNQMDNYKIKISGESKIKKIFIDIMTYVGDVNVTTNFPSEIKYNQYTSINKIYLSLNLSINSEKLNDLDFTVTSTSNSYYTILVNYDREEDMETDSFITNDLQAGYTYLVTIDPKIENSAGLSNKIIKFKNNRYPGRMPLMFNFYSLNCEVEVTTLTSSNLEIKRFRQFSHHIVESNDRYYYYELEYRLYVRETDSDNTKICKVYTSAIELSDEHEKISIDFLIPDNTHQQIMFTKDHRHVSFGYVHVDFKNDLLIKFDPQHIAQYTIKLYYENAERNKSEIIVSNDVLYLSYEKEWKNICKDSSRLCYIQLDITLSNTDFTKNPNPVLGFSIKSIASNLVSYLPKDILTTDYILNNRSQYYYTELYMYEEGFISVNFLRGSGNVYAKIVSKKDHEENPNWRGQFRFPSSEQESLEMEIFTKKIKFSIPYKDEDKDYYLLLNVFSEVEGDFNNKNLILPFNIFVYSRKTAESIKDYPLINIPLDEYVVGTVESDKNILQFYSVWLNSDAEQVIIEMQSTNAELFINVGNTKPEVGKCLFHLIPQDEDAIFTISKTNLSNREDSSIKDYNLTIGVYSNISDYQYSTPFAFKVRLGGNENDICRVNSEQKALCNTKKVSGKNRGLYIVEYDYLSDNNDNSLFIYTNVGKNASISHIFAKYISKVEYEINRGNLNKVILTEKNSNFTGRNDYLYIKDGLQKDKYLLVSVETDTETTIELISSYNSNLNGVILSPISSQLFMVKPNNTFSLNFPNNKILMVNLKSIIGSGEIHWDTDNKSNYYLEGRDDQLSMTNNTLSSKNKLLIKGTSNIQGEIGFVFFANYEIKSIINNVDPFVLYKTINFVYTNTDFPITLYTPINSLDSSSFEYYEVFVSFNILENSKKNEYEFFNDKPFSIDGYITTEENINQCKSSSDITVISNKISGVYDQALRTGIIRFTKKYITGSGIDKDQNPYLILKLEKKNAYKSYERIRFDTTAIQDHSKSPVSELSSIFGSLEKNEISREFLLRTDKSYNYMILQFSSNWTENNLSPKLKELELKKLNDDYFGKKIYYIETKEFKTNKPVILEIKRNRTQENNTIEYFMFQYTYSNSTNPVYNIQDNTIQVKKKEHQKESDYYITLRPIDNHENYNITYTIRIGGLKKTENEISKIPKKEYISIQNDGSIVKEFYNPKVSDDKIILDITRIKSFGSYIQVLAQINDKSNVEYLSYKLYNLSNAIVHNDTNPEPQNETQDENTTPNSSEDKKFFKWISENKIPFIIIVSILVTILFLVLILVSIVCIYHKKTKSLMNNINNVSFQKEKLVDNENDDEDDNILK